MTNDEAIKILDDTRDYCTKDLNEALKLAIAAIKSNWTVEKRKERAEWLKNQVFQDFNTYMEKIDCAFELQEPTLEEKFAEVFKRDFDNDLSDDQNIALHYKKAIEICREHFKTHPKELEGK
jgi:hypothetical protein